MASKEEEYKEIFMAEAIENHESLNRLLTLLEKNPSDKSSIDSIFRITHTLKGNASGMGFTEIAEMAHVLEDLFGEVRTDNFQLDSEAFGAIFKGVDTLGEQINALQSGAAVKYKGVKTKIQVLTKNKSGQTSAGPKNTMGDMPSASEEIKPNDELISETAIIEDPSNPAGTESENENKITFSDLVQVPVRKLDNLLNLVGELIIERDRLIAQNQNTRSNEYSRLNRISSDLQYSVMDVRLVQVGFLFNKFHRVVRDAANVEGKKVSLKLEGTDTEIDRNILQIISDSLIHLIRNSVGHGIELPDDRIQSGKKEEGLITLKARSESEGVIIEIIDDGKGIDIEKVREKAVKQGLILPELAKNISDKEILLYIFEPGFSTAEHVTSISGRGVGMDVVKKALDSVAGSIEVETKPNEGTTIRLSLPSSMAVKGTLLFQLMDTEYAVPLSYTEAVVSIHKKDIYKVGYGLVTKYQDQTISVVFLRDLFFGNQNEAEAQPILQRSLSKARSNTKLDLIIVNYNGKTVGFVVDKLLQQKEIVEKPLNKPVDIVRYISGVTILGNGNVCLVIHVPALIQHIFSLSFQHLIKQSLVTN